MPTKPPVFRAPWLGDPKQREAQAGRLKPNRHIYNSNRWKKLRAAHKAANPLCEECKSQGRYTPVQVTDHIKPVNDRPDLAFDWDNLRSLCNACHNRVSGKQAHK